MFKFLSGRDRLAMAAAENKRLLAKQAQLEDAVLELAGLVADGKAAEAEEGRDGEDLS